MLRHSHWLKVQSLGVGLGSMNPAQAEGCEVRDSRLTENKSSVVGIGTASRGTSKVSLRGKTASTPAVVLGASLSRALTARLRKGGLSLYTRVRANDVAAPVYNSREALRFLGLPYIDIYKRLL